MIPCGGNENSKSSVLLILIPIGVSISNIVCFEILCVSYFVDNEKRDWEVLIRKWNLMRRRNFKILQSKFGVFLCSAGLFWSRLENYLF